MKILNLGCGSKVSADENVINVDWSIYLRFKRHPLLRTVAPLVMRGKRLERFSALPQNIMVHNLAKGIPFADNSIDAVYHSHMLEHLDPAVARMFLLEVKRVLKPGGIQRIVVPDIEHACREYMTHISESEINPECVKDHDAYVAALIEQSVRREASGTSQQRPLRRYLENLFLGDARRRGETHQWMYDRFNLTYLLSELGFKDPTRKDNQTSGIAGWSRFGLDTDDNGAEYKPGSLYMEAMK